MGINKVNKKSISYFLLTFFVSLWHDKVFYKRIHIQNLDQVPKNAHLIFTGNHQNALMDALVFIFGTNRKMVFLARSDIFKNRWIAEILYFLRMLPIFRIKDGFSTLKKNDDIFLKTIETIKNQTGLVIMAEGNHGSERRLRPLKKGFARIAFQTEEANNFTLDMQIIPVGIDYSDYENFCSELLINFGKPVAVSKFIDAYKENQAIAINQLKDELAEAMKPLMVHIKSEKHYELYNELREIYKSEMAQKMGFPSYRQPYKLQADQEIIRQLELFEEKNPHKMDEFQRLVLRYKRTIVKQKISYKQAQKKPSSNFRLALQSILFILASPIFFMGWILNYFPFGLSIYIGHKMKDPQFKSSVKFAISMIVWPLFHFLETLCTWYLFKDWSITLGFFLAMPILGIIARNYWMYFIDLESSWRWSQMQKSNPKAFESIQKDQYEILELMKSVIG